MKVAITGSAGFIGSNLVEACLDLGWEVVGIDNFATGYKPMADASRVANRPGKYTFIEGDLCEPGVSAAAFKDADVVFHFAALPRVSFSVENPLEADRGNIFCTLNVLEGARQAGVRRVVFSGSSSVYGGVSEFPTPETAPAKPKSPYALHKQTGAEYCRLYSELFGLDTVTLLYFNVFGKYQRADSAYATVIPAFFEAGVNGTSCRIDGDGGQSRDFCHVENVVRANILAATSPNEFAGARFNIACGTHNTVNDVYDRINMLLGMAPNQMAKNHVEARLGDPRKSHAKIDKAIKVLGYDPIIKFEEGMRLTAQWWLQGCPITSQDKFVL